MDLLWIGGGIVFFATSWGLVTVFAHLKSED